MTDDTMMTDENPRAARQPMWDDEDDVAEALDQDALLAGTASDASTDAEPAVAVPMERALEAILIVADEPQSVVSLATAVGAPVARVREALAALVEDYDGIASGLQRGFELREVGGGWRIYVRAEYDDIVSDFVLTQNPTRLSQAALETLAVIAYKQPISRGSIASIRAVNVDSVVRTLLGRGLITEVFTDSETGAINYGTTDLLLSQLGINSIDELPHISPLLADGSEGFDADVR
jgi:segregation and condensation protein B